MTNNKDILKPDRFWTTLVATSKNGCVEDDAFMTDDFDIPSDNEVKKFVPGGVVNRKPEFKVYIRSSHVRS